MTIFVAMRFNSLFFKTQKIIGRILGWLNEGINFFGYVNRFIIHMFTFMILWVYLGYHIAFLSVKWLLHCNKKNLISKNTSDFFNKMMKN